MYMQSVERGTVCMQNVLECVYTQCSEVDYVYTQSVVGSVCVYTQYGEVDCVYRQTGEWECMCTCRLVSGNVCVYTRVW